ncbi:inosine/xanthosine triphosphatase [Candidatus Woesearchaeota archaeon]|nr:inosine/xanthosine triphosphatase [Candidatus Woesearchaeota archaeon]
MNPVKVEAVQETVRDYVLFRNAIIISRDVLSEVSAQPRSLEETIRGARNRATNAFDDCDYSFGLESGLIAVPYTKSGFMDLCACVVYDGNVYNLGLSSAFECPESITLLMTEQGMDMNRAFYHAGLSTDPKLGSSEGAVGLLTNGRVTRKDYTKQAIVMALIHVERKQC